MQEIDSLLDLWSMLENIMIAALGVFLLSVITLMLERDTDA
ncbi:hypothetical protein [Vibrio sp. RE86]|nr:hypothetical protein [Vibrio sp. RE86]